MNFIKMVKYILFGSALIFSFSAGAENPYDTLNSDPSSTSAVVPAPGSCKDCISHFRDVKEPVLALDHKYNCYPLGKCKTSDSKSSSPSDSTEATTGR